MRYMSYQGKYLNLHLFNYKQNTRVRGPVVLFCLYMPKADRDVQEVHSIHLCVINASGMGARSQLLRDSVSGNSYESTLLIPHVTP